MTLFKRHYKFKQMGVNGLSAACMELNGRSEIYVDEKHSLPFWTGEISAAVCEVHRDNCAPAPQLHHTSQLLLFYRQL